MKVMSKTGMLKDGSDLSKAIAPGASLTVIGTAGPLPEAPKQPIKFLEDMDDRELAAGQKQSPGLVNLGNTCYMNASLQAMRTIPELETALQNYQPSSSSLALAAPADKLTNSLKQLVKSMSQTTEPFPPLHFLSTLRQVAPQFAEQSRQGGYAQQDADEMWTQTISSIHQSLRLPENSTSGSSNSSSSSFVDRYLAADLQQTLTCDEAPEEPPTVKTDRVFKLDCNISINTNYLMSGIMDSLDSKIEKNSPSLGRSAVYTQKSRLTRLPANLTIHMVRFYWRQDIQKKAKIMRKVKFPMDLDVLDLLTDEMRDKIRPINLAMKDIDKARMERAKIRKRTKKLKEDSERAAAKRPAGATVDEERESELKTSTEASDKLEDEDEMRKKEREQIEKLVRDQGVAEDGANTSGIYELCGEFVKVSFPSTHAPQR